MGEEVARKVEQKAEGSKVPQSPQLSLGQPTEEEILEATTSLFACAGSDTGELLRINVHHGPRDHLGERFVIVRSTLLHHTAHVQFHGLFLFLSRNDTLRFI